MKMTSNKPYLIRALHAWITDNHMTAHIIVNTTKNNVNVPQQYIKDGQIVLNISLNATLKLLIDDHALSFSARFSGVLKEVWMPISAIIGIYARETGMGMFFDPEDDNGSDHPGPEGTSPSSPNKPKLTLVKG